MRLHLFLALVLPALPLFGCTQATGQPDTISQQTVAAGLNQSFSHTLTTSASSEAIWELWTNIETWKSWDLGLKDAQIEGPFSLGAKGKIIPLSGPPADFVVTQYDAGKMYAFSTKLPFATLNVRRTIIGIAPVVFRHDVSFTGPLAGFWASRFGPAFRTALPPTMAKLKALGEANVISPP